MQERENEFRRSDSWNQFQKNGGGLLIVGHGTRKPEGTQQLLSLARQMSSLLRSEPPGESSSGKVDGQFAELAIEPCFLELAEPSIEAGVARLVARGIRRVLVVPILLFTAGHAKEDIPDAVQAVADRYAIEVVGQSSALETHAVGLELSTLRYQQALQASNSLGENVALAMVGRGARDESAVTKMKEFTRLRVLRTPVAWAQTGFFAVAKPSLDELLHQIASTSFGEVVVQPHLLFEGELMDELRKKVAVFQGKDPSRRWILGSVLGADLALAKTFVSLAEFELEQLKSP